MISELSWKVIAVVGSMAVGIASYKYFGLPQDNPIEEEAEVIIKDNTGMSVDLSPDTKELTNGSQD